MMVGAWPAPMAVLILVLYASFWKVVALILVFGLAALNRFTLAVRIASPGGPDRVGPELPQAARAASVSGTPTANLRNVRREVVVGSTLISVVASRGLPRRPII